MNEPHELPPLDDAAKRRAWGRFALGNAQMFFAVVTIIVALMAGLTVLTVILGVFTTALTLTSVCLYRDFLGLRRK